MEWSVCRLAGTSSSSPTKEHNKGLDKEAEERGTPLGACDGEEAPPAWGEK